MLKGAFILWIALLVAVYLRTSNAAEKPHEGLDIDLKDEKVALKTDDDVARREEESISRLAGYTEEEARMMEMKKQQFAYKAEVARVMDILVGALYSNRDIFLRELISNASDALDKIRYQSLTDLSLLGDVKDLDIRIQADPVARTLTITDTGIGMTKEELVANLGTIARSGTKEFSKALAEGTASNLIGQFGVGFYSAFLIADKVTVQSKSNDDPVQHIWESVAANGFSVVEDPKGNTLGRGTRITLHLKSAEDDAELNDFIDASKLRDLVRKYSEFINFPIYLWTSTVVDEEVEDDTVEKVEEEETEDDVDVEDKEDEDEEEEDEPKKKTVSKTVWDWERVNTTRPIWTRNPSDVTEEEYQAFYQALTKDTKNSLAYQHFSAEGDVEFRSILFLPEEPPFGQFDPSVRQRGVKLYVRRVFITDDFDTVIPKYLGFLKGVVDSDDLPLNVSRETLQQSKVLDQIKKKLVRKAIAMFQTLSQEPEKYDKFYKQYGVNLKLGVIEDVQNRTRLSKLLKFHSSKTDGLVTFDEYVERLKDGQDQIYYVAGESLESLKNSPLAERLLKNDFEVLYMVDPIDEYVMQHMSKYDSKYKLTNLGHEGVKLPEGLDKDDKEEDFDEVYKPLITFLQKELSDRIGRVKVSNRLTRSPCTIVAESWGYTATMERVVKAQALADPSSQQRAWVGKKVMEINPKHPLIEELNRLVKDDAESQVAVDAAKLLLESSALASGYTLDDPSVFVNRLHRILATSLDVDLPAEETPAPKPATTKPMDDEEADVEIDMDDEHTHDEL